MGKFTKNEKLAVGWTGTLVFGRHVKPVGDEYTGMFKGGRFHGEGQMIYAHGGGSYKGPYRKGLQHGEGVQIFGSGNRYEGECPVNYEGNSLTVSGAAKVLSQHSPVMFTWASFATINITATESLRTALAIGTRVNFCLACLTGEESTRMQTVVITTESISLSLTSTIMALSFRTQTASAMDSAFVSGRAETGTKASGAMI